MLLRKLHARCNKLLALPPSGLLERKFLVFPGRLYPGRRFRLNLETAVETGSKQKCPAKQRFAGGCPFALRVKGVGHRFQTVIPAKAGIHGSKKRRPCKCLAWVPAFAGTTVRLDSACVFTRKSASTAVSRLIHLSQMDQWLTHA